MQKEMRDPRDKRSASPERFRRTHRYGGHRSRSYVRERVSLESLARIPRLCSLKEYLDAVEPYSTREDTIIQNYRNYKKLYMQVQRRAFFDAHKAEEWFIEKYCPETRAERCKEMVKQVESRHEQFFMAYLDDKLRDFALDWDGSASYSGLEIVQSVFPDPPAIAIRSIPPTLRKVQLLKAVDSLDGFEQLILEKPSPAKRFCRVGWALFNKSSDPGLAGQLEKLRGLNVEGYELYCSLYKSGQQNKLDRLRKSKECQKTVGEDLDLAKNLVRKLDHQWGLENKNLLLDPQSTGDPRHALDLLILYLRMVHFTCYYCVLVAESLIELDRECGSLHVRCADDSMQTEPDRVSKLEDWLQQSFTDDTTKNPQEMVEAELRERYVVPLDKNDPKSRCSQCSKLFMAPDYVLKHLHLKHQDLVDKVSGECRMLQLFDLDKEWDRYILEAGAEDRGRDYSPDRTWRDEESRRGNRRGIDQDSNQDGPRKLRSYTDLDARPDTRYLDYGYNFKDQDS